MRPGRYSWSDDLGRTWQQLEGVPHDTGEVYQPWIHHLGDGRIACAGHYGADDAVGSRDQAVYLHCFRVQQQRRTEETRIEVEREFEEAEGRYRNAYTVTLTAGGRPLAGRELEFWYVERDQPGYDPWSSQALEVRMERGGQRLRLRTGSDGTVRAALPHLDAVQDVHHSYQLVVRFNSDRADPDYKPAQTPQLEFYARSSWPDAG
jgi:hypothetical protein